MTISFRSGARGLFSPLFTIILFIVMASYLIRGKFFGGPLRPETMMLFAGVILLHGGGALCQRLFLLLRHVTPPCRQKVARAGYPSSCDMHRGVEILRRRGFKVVSGEFDEGACLVKGGRRAVFLEIASYGGLL